MADQTSGTLRNVGHHVRVSNVQRARYTGLVIPIGKVFRQRHVSASETQGLDVTVANSIDVD
jgi:hypothetical protein